MIPAETLRQDTSAGGAVVAFKGSRSRAWLEIAGAYGLILATIWTRRPLQEWLYWAATLWVVITAWMSFPGWNVLGFRRGGFWRSVWVTIAAALLFAIAFFVADRLHTLREPRAARGWLMTFGGYVVWSFAQQFLLQSYFLFRFRRILKSPAWAAVVSASIFALAHLPNPILAPVTLIWGLCACFVFLRHRNLYPLAIAHATLGICVAITVPGPVVHNMRVGLGYLRYHAPHAHEAPALPITGSTTKP